MRIVKIDTIVFDYGMWIDGYSQSSKVKSEVVNNLDGGVIIFEQPVRTSAENITLVSGIDGWQTPATVAALIALANGSIGQTYIAYDELGGTFNVRFRHEQSGGAVQFDRLFDAKECPYYTGSIYLAKV